MSLVLKVGGGEAREWENHPEGMMPITCVDVVDVGYVETMYGPKAKARLVFFGGHYTTKDDGDKIPLLVMEQATASLHPKSRLYQFIDSWLGKEFKDAAAKGEFDLDHLIGRSGFAKIEHNEGSNGRVYANIKTIMELPEGMTAPPIPSDFVRMKDREDWEGPRPHPEMAKEPPKEPEWMAE